MKVRGRFLLCFWLMATQKIQTFCILPNYSHPGLALRGVTTKRTLSVLVSNQNMDPVLRDQIVNRLRECTGTVLLFSDHSRMEALISIPWLKDSIPKPLLNQIVEFASNCDGQDDDVLCAKCGEKEMHISPNEITLNRDYATWFRIRARNTKYDQFICEECIVSDDIEVCLDCKRGILEVLPFPCEGVDTTPQEHGFCCEACCSANVNSTKYDIDLDGVMRQRMISCLRCMLSRLNDPDYPQEIAVDDSARKKKSIYKSP